MKRMMALFMLLFLAAGLAPAARNRQRGWFIAGAAAFSRLAPGDLNARALAQQALTDFTYRAGYEAQQRAAAGAFTYVLREAEGSGLKGISGGFPFAMRIGRVLGPRVAVFAGLQFLHHPQTALAVAAERAFLLRLEGGCQVPIGAHATLEGTTVHLTGLIASFAKRSASSGGREGRGRWKGQITIEDPGSASRAMRLRAEGADVFMLVMLHG